MYYLETLAPFMHYHIPGESVAAPGPDTGVAAGEGVFDVDIVTVYSATNSAAQGRNLVSCPASFPSWSRPQPLPPSVLLGDPGVAD